MEKLSNQQSSKSIDYSGCAYLTHISYKYNTEKHVEKLNKIAKRLVTKNKFMLYAVISIIGADTSYQTTYFILNEQLWKRIKYAISTHKNKNVFLVYELLLILREYDRTRELFKMCENCVGSIKFGRLGIYPINDPALPKYFLKNMETLNNIMSKYTMDSPVMTYHTIMTELNKISISRGVLNGEVIKSASI